MTCSVENQGPRVAPRLAQESMKHRVRPSAVQRWRHFKDDPVVRGAPANRGAIKVPGGVKDEREGLRSSFELPPPLVRSYSKRLLEEEKILARTSLGRMLHQDKL